MGYFRNDSCVLTDFPSRFDDRHFLALEAGKVTNFLSLFFPIMTWCMASGYLRSLPVGAVVKTNVLALFDTNVHFLESFSIKIIDIRLLQYVSAHDRNNILHWPNVSVCENKHAIFSNSLFLFIHQSLPIIN